MQLHANLALAKQAYEQLSALCEPSRVTSWNPSSDQREIYVRLGERILDALDELARLEQTQLLMEHQVQSLLPEAQLDFIRQRLQPSASAIRDALDHLNPDGALFREFCSRVGRPSGAQGRIRATFDVALQRTLDLIERNPDLQQDHPLEPEAAKEVLTSRLIQFDPDAWLDRVGDLSPVRSHRKNFRIPSQARLRLEELYRLYVFGCWLSVFGLARAILEYAILDNLHKFNVDPRWPADRAGTRKDKKLSRLIDEIAGFLPGCQQAMNLLRECGNDYLHPKRSDVSKRSLFDRQTRAQEVVTALVEVVETIYLYDSNHPKTAP